MNIAVLGGGVEGQAIKKYFIEKGEHVQIFDNFTDEQIPSFKLEDYNLVFRSPSVHPLDPSWTSSTKYFFDNCPAPIIGVTGTKGKGTTCSMISAILREILKASDWPSRTVHLLGNIGTPAITALDSIAADDIVVYELSSFQLWDLKKSPHIAVILRIEPDHLDRHSDFADYVNAKSNIVRYQSPSDYCIYHSKSAESIKICELSPAAPDHKLPYPPENTPKLEDTLGSLKIPGSHNRENATAALLACAAFFHQSLDEFIDTNSTSIKTAFENFKGLPHRLEYVRTINGIDYYDDNYSSAYPALDVALAAFEDQNCPIILIAGGKDRHLDLTSTKARLFSAKNLKKVILIGETKDQLAANESPEKYLLADTLEEAVQLAKTAAEKVSEDAATNFDLCIPSTPVGKAPVVLMSPGAASFDMFKNFNDRGEKFKNIVNKIPK